ncbi:MAG: nucleotidyl transferase AbiEii/AbiGii toxin family protein [Bryobacter sp.]
MDNSVLSPHFREFLKCLLDHSVEFLLIGGYAVSYHGWPRNTKDIDCWISGDPENQSRTIAALRDFAFPRAADDLFAEEDAMVRFGVPPSRVEVIKKISGLNFAEAWPNRVIWHVDGLAIPVIGLKELRQNKAASGRPQDLADLDHLPPA